ncbi:GNAT family N-acetyltransferase [Spirillospora sp. CA-108201]
MSETSDPRSPLTSGDPRADAVHVPSGTVADDRRVIYEGDQVLLRMITAADEAEFVALAKTSKEQFRPFRPWPMAPTKPSRFRRYMSRYGAEGVFGFVVCLRTTKAIVGFIDITVGSNVWHLRQGEVAYATFVAHQKHGYMTEALSLAIRYGFEQLRLDRLQAEILSENTASLRLAEKVGFLKEGSSIEHHIEDGVEIDLWSITREQVDTYPMYARVDDQP